MFLRLTYDCCVIQVFKNSVLYNSEIQSKCCDRTIKRSHASQRSLNTTEIWEPYEFYNLSCGRFCKHVAQRYLKKPLQPSQVMALKWNPVALSPQTPQIRGALRSNSSVPCADVLTAMASITERKKQRKENNTECEYDC